MPSSSDLWATVPYSWKPSLIKNHGITILAQSSFDNFSGSANIFGGQAYIITVVQQLLEGTCQLHPDEKLALTLLIKILYIVNPSSKCHKQSENGVKSIVIRGSRSWSFMSNRAACQFVFGRGKKNVVA